MDSFVGSEGGGASPSSALRDLMNRSNINDWHMLNTGSLVCIEDTNKVRQEMVMIICGWLEENGFRASVHTLREEAGLLRREEYTRRKAAKSAIKAVEEGSWDGVGPLLQKVASESRHRALSYLVARQQLLEIVDTGDGQKAYTFFMKRIKPLEPSISKHEFNNLLYLLTAKSVADASGTIPGLSDWSVESGRHSVALHLRNAVSHGDFGLETEVYFHQHGIQPVREQLSRLLQQAYSFQLLIASGMLVPPSLKNLAPVVIKSVVKDAFEHLPPINPVLTIETGQHLNAIQVFPNSNVVVTGASDGAVTLWSIDEAPEELPQSTAATSRQFPLGRHEGKVWQLSGLSDRDKETVVSCGADGVAMLFDVAKRSLLGVFSGHDGDLFSVALASGFGAVACGAYNGEISVWDTQSKARLNGYRFTNSAIVSLCFSRHGCSLYSGSKDGFVRIIDIASGVLTVVVKPPLQAEITSLALSPSACYLAVSYKNNTTRIWDLLRNEFLPTRFTGNLNTNRNFVRCTFAQENYLVAGSEDGQLVMWELTHDVLRGETAEDLEGYEGPSASSSQLATTAQGGQQTPSSRTHRRIEKNSTTAIGGSSATQSGTVTVGGGGGAIGGGVVSITLAAQKMPFHAPSMVTDVSASVKHQLLVSCSVHGRVVVCQPRIEELDSSASLSPSVVATSQRPTREHGMKVNGGPMADSKTYDT